MYYMPEDLPSLKGIRFLRTGLLLGELKKNRFEPSQAFAMNLKKEEYRRTLDLPAEDPRVIRYLKGETLDVEDLVSNREKGWYLVCVDGYPLGFGKLVNQTLKNSIFQGGRWLTQEIRLDKYLADMGCGTRSQVKRGITKGGAEVNGVKVTRPEEKIDTERDTVLFNGMTVGYAEFEYYH